MLAYVNGAMDSSFPLVMLLVMVVVAFATVWLVKRFVQPPTAAGKKRLAIFLRFIVAQYVVITILVLASVRHILPPRWMGIIGLANFVCSFLIMWIALKRAPISDQDVSQAQRLRAIKSSKLLVIIYVIALLNGFRFIGKLPLWGIIAGIAVNVLIVVALITNIRRNQAKLDEGKLRT